MLSTPATPAAMAAAGASHALVDLTDRPRVGFRGADARAYLEGHGFDVPQNPNHAVQQADGSVVAALSSTEYLILGGAQDGGARIALQENNWALSTRANYLLPRQDSHAWLMLAGPRVPDVMAKVCGVDLRPRHFAVGSVAQTSVARVNAIVIHAQKNTESVFHVLFDRCSLAYFREALVDALQEFGGHLNG